MTIVPKVYTNPGKCKSRRKAEGPGRRLGSKSPRATSPEQTEDTGQAIKIKGVFLFDPATSTHAAFREFLWDGLRFLAKAAEARGLPAEQRNKMLCQAFDCMSQVSTDGWGMLKQFLASPDASCLDADEEAYHAQPESLEAFAENQPVPVEVSYLPEYDILSPEDPE